MSEMRMPILIPAGWKPYLGKMISRQSVSGLCALFSIDEHDSKDIDCPPMGEGSYRHISLSRPNKYPEWDEMRDFIYACGLFDDKRDVCMFIPPKNQYVNVHNNCFHFYQKIVVAESE